VSRDTDRESHLLQLISESFRGVELGDGVSLHETIVLDNYGSAQERQAARAPDEKRDWRKLVDDPELANVYGIGGLSFYDAAGLRFHLPAYLSLAVKDPDQQVVWELHFHLTHLSEYNRQRLAILSPSQRRCVWEVLRYLRDLAGAEDATLDAAIQGYWNPVSESGLCNG
jgi:hypothetical protein